MNFEFIEKKTDGREYLLPSPLNTDFSFAAFTSKVGGFSHGKIEGLNLGFRVGDARSPPTSASTSTRPSSQGRPTPII